MNETKSGSRVIRTTAAERVEEAQQLARSIFETLQSALMRIADGHFDELVGLDELQARLETALRHCDVMESRYEDAFGEEAAGIGLSLDEIRADIERRLDRIQVAAGEDGVSGEPDGG